MSEFLKCDADGCDHVEHMAEITADMVGRPCPKCGANLLTQGDFTTYMSMVRPLMQGLIDAGLSQPATADTPPEQRVSVNYHDGTLKVSGLKSVG